MSKPLKVIQCGTGIAGQQALGAILERPDLALAGLLVHSESNVGRDAGAFIGQPDSGVLATRDVAALAAGDADIVSYMLMVPNLDDICTFLAAGKNVVTTAGYMYPRWNNKEAERRLQAACTEGQSSFFVTGINPGFVDEILPLTLSMLSRDWKQLRITEYADCSKYPNKGAIDIMGFGYTLADIEAGKVFDMKTMVDFFEASVAGLAHELGVDLDRIEQTREFALTDKPIQLAFGEVAPGTVAGQRWRWAGIKDGVELLVQETYWILAPDLAPGWPRKEEMTCDCRWQVTIEGTPSLRLNFEPAQSFEPGASREGGVNPSAAATAMAAINSLHSVVQARTGIVSGADLRQPRFKN
jgi:2,4-diaminopentanoate dehydrogenase